MTSKAMVAGGDYSAGGCKRQMAGLKCPVGTQKRLRQRESLRRVVPLVRVARCGATGSCALTKSAQENTAKNGCGGGAPPNFQKKAGGGALHYTKGGRPPLLVFFFSLEKNNRVFFM